MTEAAWWAATAPDRLIDLVFHDAKAADRKLRLFSVACCDRVRDLVGDPAYLGFLDAAEAFADGRIGEEERARTSRAGWTRHVASTGRRRPKLSPSVDCARRACLHTIDEPEPDRRRSFYRESDNVPNVHSISYRVWEAFMDGVAVRCPAVAAEKLRQVRLLHDIFGPLPFREVAVPAAWLTSDVTALARGIYDEKAFDRMPILADALQDAGCDNDEILTHCRDGNGGHVRGCWVLDLLLGRPWRM